ncbi:MAG: tRNA pseudouridine(13) synthase TruD [Leptonema sp. (in: bacteria)]
MKSIGFLSGKIKQKQEDFIVTEKVNLKINPKDQDPYYVYKLTKKEWNTHDILIKIAKHNNIRFQEIAFGGRKDRYGITTQYITTKKKLLLPNSYKDKVQLEYLGTSKEPMESKKIIENEFIITVRDIRKTDIPKILENVDEIKQFGFINYYDSQRFSTFDVTYGIPLFYLIEENYSNFLKYYLSHSIPKESSEAKDRKYSFLTNWMNWKYCLRISKTQIEKRIFQYLSKNKNIKNILNYIPSQELKFMFSIFQSYVWNLSVVEYLKQKTNLFYFKTRIGNLGFTKQYKEKDLLFFPLIYKDTYKIPEYSSYMVAVSAKIFEMYLHSKYDESRFNKFLNLRIKNQTFAYKFRNLQVFPKNFQILEIKEDDNNKNKMLLRLKFSLESGCYGTMLIKRLLARI